VLEYWWVALLAACREQAERVSVWPGPSADPQPVALLNHSDEPVYEAVATFVFIDGLGPTRGEEVSPELAARRIRVGVIPPGRWRVCVDGGWNGMYPRLGLEVAFTDRAGAHWVRRADGRLEELPRGAFDYFELSRPLESTPPEPVHISESRPGHRARVRTFSLGDGLGPALVSPLFVRLDRHDGNPRRRVRGVRSPPSREVWTPGLARGHLARPHRRLSAAHTAPAGSLRDSQRRLRASSAASSERSSGRSSCCSV
jgi:hypothetical protein